MLFIRKKDGAHNICVDYRRLNKFIINNIYPIQRINKLFNQIVGVGFFSEVVLKSVYHQLSFIDVD